MKFAALVFPSTVAFAMAQGESSSLSEQKFGDLGDFKLEKRRGHTGLPHRLSHVGEVK